MQLILVLRNTITIILVTLPVFKCSRIPAAERRAEFMKDKNLKLKVMNDYSNVSEKLMLNEFVLSKKEMYEYAEYVNKNGKKPKWIESHRLENPELYKLLRFSNKIESMRSRNKDKMIHRLTKLKINIFKFSSQVSILQTCRQYVAKDLNELISLENYYAIQILSKVFSIHMELDNPVSWRMKGALYSLALRQYSQNYDSNFSPIICYITAMQNESISYDALKKFSNKRQFVYCSSRNNQPEKLSKSSFVNLQISTSYSIFYRFEIIDPKLIGNLEEVIDGDSPQFYFLLPDIKFQVVKGPAVYNTVNGLAVFIEFITIPTRGTSKWLVKMANNIEMYKRKEIGYFKKFTPVRMMRL